MSSSIHSHQASTSAITSHFNELRLAMLKVDVAKINDIARIILRIHENGGKIFTCGNGGSYSVASHMAADFNKCLSSDAGIDLDFTCLCDNVPTLMAWSNDASYDVALSMQLTPGRTQECDCLLCFSGSGNSKNILNAAHQASVLGMDTVAFCGCGGGKLAEICKYSYVVDSYDMQIIEDIFSCIMHALFKSIKASADKARNEAMISRKIGKAS